MQIQGKKQRTIHRLRGAIMALLTLAWLIVAAGWIKTERVLDRRAQDKLYAYPSYAGDSIRCLNLVVEKDDWQKLVDKRAEALRSGILAVKEGEEVKAKLQEGAKEWKVKMRLKGDWVDHLRGRKWSYRISLKAGEAWEGMTTFSLQTPAARDFLHEWIYHKLLEEVDVLTTRYTFVWLKVNGESMGIYALEEHFEKQLVESRMRREGPILKFSEEGLWKLRQQHVWEHCRFSDDGRIAQGADIEAFRMSKTLADPTLRKEFEIGQSLMQQYRNRVGSPSDIFDIDRMMRHYAMADLCRTYHGLIWHNQRFYYNPISQRLEPIGFDGDTGGNMSYWVKEGFLIQGGGRVGETVLWVIKEKPAYALFKKHLETYSHPDWLAQFFDHYDAELQHWERLLAKEFEGYQYDRKPLMRNAEKAQNLSMKLREYDEFVENPWK